MAHNQACPKGADLTVGSWMIWCNAAKVQILVSVLFLADLPVLPMIENI